MSDIELYIIYGAGSAQSCWELQLFRLNLLSALFAGMDPHPSHCKMLRRLKSSDLLESSANE